MRKTTNQQWLALAESVSLAGSTLGLVAAVVSQQMVYFAAPLTLALTLNFAGRQRFIRQFQQQSKEAFTSLGQEVQFLSHQVQALPPPAEPFDPLPLQIEISILATRMQDLSQVVQSLTSETELEEQIPSLEPASVDTHLASLEALDLKPIETDTSQLWGLFEVTQRLNNLPTIAQFDSLNEVSCYASKFLKQPKLGAGFSV